MQTENNKPLWKVLNEKRTQGAWKVLFNNYTHADTINRDINTRICSIDHGAVWANEVGYNAQYTALAVNNLHKLAEALEDLIDKYDELYREQNPFAGTEITGLIKAKETLKAIS